MASIKYWRMRVAALLAIVALSFVCVGTAWAADPAGVVRSGEDRNAISDPQTFIGNNDPHTGADNFAKDAPVGTITINTASMTLAKGGEFIPINNKFEVDTNASGRTENWVVYKENLPQNSPIEENGDCFQILFPGIATLQDGSSADVLLTYSNVLLDARTNNGVSQVEAPLGIANGQTVGVRNSVVTGQNANGANVYGQAYALAVDINVKIVKGSNHEPVPGTVLFSTVDLDVGGNANYTKADENNNYKESFEIVSGAVSPAYIPTYNVCEIIGQGSESSANGVTFASTEGHDPNDFYEGFVVLADSSEGITLRWRGQGNGMGTTLFTGNISHSIKSTTTKGGKIQTTSNGNSNGELTDGNVLGPVNVDVPDGKTMVYTLTPDSGYQLSTLTVDGEEIDVSSLKKGDSKEVTLSDGTKAKVTYNSDGTYNFEFPNNKSNHTIDVAWAPEVTATSGKGGSISDEGVTVVPGEPVLDEDGRPVLDEDGNAKLTPGKKKYTFTPEPGYTIGPVTVNGKEVTPVKNSDGTWSFEIEDIDEPTTIDVQWTPLFSVSFENGPHGTSRGGNQTDVPEGDKPKGGNSVTPDKGWAFSGKYTYTITKPDGTVETGTTDDPTSIEVTGDIVFTPIYNPIVTATSGKGGSISNAGTTAVESGGKLVYTFTPQPGYTIGKVTVNGVEVTPIDNGDGTWSYVLDNITEPTEIHVEWEKIPDVMPATGDPLIPAAIALMGAACFMMFARRRTA